MFTDGEVPGGVVDGTNATFTLANTPSPAGSLVLYRNGIAQKAGVDYTLTGRPYNFSPARFRSRATRCWHGTGSRPGAHRRTDGSGPRSMQRGGRHVVSDLHIARQLHIPANVLQTGDRVQIDFDLGTQARRRVRVQGVLGQYGAGGPDGQRGGADDAGKGESGVQRRRTTAE